MNQQASNPFSRASGVLLHITSLPGRFGSGDLGSEAYQFVDFLQAADQRLWQILPLTPTGFGNCPYSSTSALAGNHYLISPEKLCERGLLEASDLENAPPFPDNHVDFGWMIDYRMKLLHKAFHHFNQLSNRTKIKIAHKKFCEANQEWLEDYTVFMALKHKYQGSRWDNWSAEDQSASAETHKRCMDELGDIIEFHRFLQSEFAAQWHALRAYANSKNVKFVGDIPIFVGYDSSEVWGNKQAFKLDEHYKPTVVAGCPPDAFAATGQLWGNPHYNWQHMMDTDFAWWKQRFTKQFELYDIVRIDHFRGFAAYWEIPASAPTAEEQYGAKWVYGYGNELFSALHKTFGSAPIIAEDLGTITPDVVELRKNNNYPGMKIMQFGFESCNPNDGFLPWNAEEDFVIYTGTHDNDTTLGWYRSAPQHIKDFYHQHVNASNEHEAVWEMIRLGMESKAVFCITPLQDILVQGSEARMNFPGIAENQWQYRYPAHLLTANHAQQLATLVQKTQRQG